MLDAQPITPVLLDAIKVLDARWKELPVDKHEFAASLAKQFKSKGCLSDKQWPWVEKLADAIQCAGVPDFTQAEEKEIGEMMGLVDFFAKAKEKMKWPVLVVHTGVFGFRISPATSLGKNPGAVYVKGNKTGQYVGMVGSKGDWCPANAWSPHSASGASLHALLVKLSRHPAETLSEQGLANGKCCMCNTALTDPISMAVGYGKVCAQHFGLPYGKAAAEKTNYHWQEQFAS